MPPPTGALMVGSVPLKAAATVFNTLVRALPNRLHSIPDGETGIRGNFIFWQHGVFPQRILQQRAGGPADPDASKAPELALADFKPTGYDDAAIESYAVFKELKEKETIPLNIRFQVSLPSPTTAVRMFVATPFCAVAEPLYQTRLLEALREIQENIPAEQLLIQWDVPMEVGLLEYESGRLKDDPYFEPYFAPLKHGIMQRWRQLAAAVDQNVQIGFHLCYGDVRHRHFIEPEDSRLVVDLANDLVREVGTIHPVHYIHLPVPKNRTEASFFEPLRDLEIGTTKLFAGLAHPGDLEGTKKRIEAVQTAYKGDFGITTECGLGRTPPEEVEGILDIVRAVTGTR